MAKLSRKLSKDAKILLLVGIMYASGMTIAATFVNVYLIRLTNDMGLIILQNIVNYAVLLGAFIFASYYVSKGSILRILRIGILSTIAYYTLILVLKENASKYLMFIGAFNGLGMGFYYFSFNILLGKFTDENNRSAFFGYQTMFSYVFGVLAPMVSGYIIVKFSELTGYYVLFAASVTVLVSGIGLSLFLKNADFKTTYNILPILKIKNNRYWNTLSLFSFTFSFRESLYGQIFMVFSYLVISNEQVIGNFNALMSFIGVLSASLVASKIVPQTQKKHYQIASVGYFISMLTLAIFPSEKTLLLSYILNGVFICWIMVISGSLNYQLSSRAKEGHDQGEYIIASEFPIAAGRVAALLIFFMLERLFTGMNLYRFILAVISVGAFVDYAIIKHQVQWFEDENVSD